MRLERNKGFTLIELIVVIAILGILVLLAAPKIIGYIQDAKLAQIKNDSKAHESAVTVEMTSNPNYIHYIKQNWEPASYEELIQASDEDRLYDKTGNITFNGFCSGENNNDGPNYQGLNNRIILADVAPSFPPGIFDELKGDCFEFPEHYVNTKLPGKFIMNEEGEVVYIHNKSVSKGGNGNQNGSNPDGSNENESVDPNYNKPPLHSNPASDFLGEVYTAEESLAELENSLNNGWISQEDFDAEIVDLKDIYVIYEYVGTSTDVVIPGKIQGADVSYIDDSAFEGKGLTSIYIPNTVGAIGENAFKDNFIKNLVLPSELVYVWNGAFANNPLETLQFGNKVTQINPYAFNNTKLTEITLPRSLLFIYDFTFGNTPTLTIVNTYSRENFESYFEPHVIINYLH